jgi:cell wall-associated NlpC family hydrolase
VTGNSVSAYITQVDRVLGAGQSLYGAPTAPADIHSDTASLVPQPLGSGLRTGVAGAADRYRQQSSAITALDADTAGAAADGNSHRQQGASASTEVRETARAQAAAIAPATGTPGAVKVLVSRMDERLAAMQQQLDTTKVQNQLLATRLRQLAAAYRIGAATSSLSRASPLTLGQGGGSSPFGSLASAPMSALSAFGADRRRQVDAELAGASTTGAPPSEPATRAVQYARTKLGLPYVWGAEGPRAYDCSGLVQDAYRHAGIALPRTTYDLIAVGRPVPRSQIREGDLILSNFSAPGRPEHVQLAVSPTRVIEAPTPGGHVQYSAIPSGHIVVKRVT